MYSETKKKTPNIASATRSIDEVRARVRAVAEELEREHRVAAAALDDDEGRERDDGEHERADDPRRGPAVRVRLDQAVRQREEADRRRGEAGQVEARVRLVARLVDEEVARDDSEDADRDVDEEDPAPARGAR